MCVLVCSVESPLHVAVCVSLYVVMRVRYMCSHAHATYHTHTLCVSICVLIHIYCWTQVCVLIHVAVCPYTCGGVCVHMCRYACQLLEFSYVSFICVLILVLYMCSYTSPFYMSFICVRYMWSLYPLYMCPYMLYAYCGG